MRDDGAIQMGHHRPGRTRQPAMGRRIAANRPCANSSGLIFSPGSPGMVTSTISSGSSRAWRSTAPAERRPSRARAARTRCSARNTRSITSLSPAASASVSWTPNGTLARTGQRQSTARPRRQRPWLGVRPAPPRAACWPRRAPRSCCFRVLVAPGTCPTRPRAASRAGSHAELALRLRGCQSRGDPTKT